MKNIEPKTNPVSDFKYWSIAIYAVLIITVLKGIRFPNMWSYSHFLFNYDQGFIKRGLLGAIVSMLNFPFLGSYEFFFYFSLIIFFVNIILFCSLIKDLIGDKDQILFLLSLVFVSSLAIVFLSHTVGYSDNIGLLITLIAIRINSFYKKIRFLLFAFPVALLIHEAILILFYPVVFISLLLSIDIEKRRKEIVILGIFSLVMIIIAVVVGNTTLTLPQVNDLYSQLQSKTVYPLRKDAFYVLAVDAKDNFNVMQSFWSSQETLLQFALSLLVTVPSALAFIYFIVLTLKKTKVNSYMVLISVLAAVSPFLMHFAGWDMHRWNTLTITTCFLMFYVVLTKNKYQSFTSSRHLSPVLIFLVFLNGISPILLFDGYYIKQYPFLDHLFYIFKLINGTAKFPPGI